MPFLPENGQPVLVSEAKHKEFCALFAAHRIAYYDFSKFIGGTSSVLALFRIEDKQEWEDAAFLWRDLTGLNS